MEMPGPFHHAWYQAMTLAERSASLRAVPQQKLNGQVDHHRAQRRLRRWKSQSPFTADSFFALPLSHCSYSTGVIT